MTFRFKLLACLTIAAALSACGGGGGGSDTPDGSYLRLTPSANISTYEGESVAFSIVGVSSRNFDVQPQIAILETTGAITTDVWIMQNGALSYEVSLKTAPALPAGEQAIKLTVRICEDDPLVCRKPFPGSPWTVTQKVSVKPKSEAAKRLTLTPSGFDLSAYAGEPLALVVDAAGSGFPSRGYAGISDPLNLVTLQGEISHDYTSGQPKFIGRMETRPDLAPGVYETQVKVSLCAEPDTVTCRTPFSGSPWLVPVKFTIKSGTNLTPLPTLSQLGAWSTFDGNAAHNAHVAANFNPANFTRRWSVPTDEVAVASTSIAVDGGRVFHVHKVAAGNYELRAIREDSGQVEWRVDLGALSQVNAPAAANGRIYLTSTGHADTFYWAFEQATGKLLSKQTMYSQWGTYLAPTIYGTDVYTESGYYGGISKFDGLTHALVWNAYMPQVDNWTPAVDANYAYVFIDGKLRAQPTGGGTGFEISIPEGGYSAAVPALSGKQMAYVVAAGNLHAFDLAARTRAWTVPQVQGRVVVANDVVYALRPGAGASGGATVIEARSADKGELLWTSEALTGTQYDTHFDKLLVTNNLAFVASDLSTLAVDLSTRKVVWKDKLGGSLALSNRGVLYIFNKTVTGYLTAVNLQ
jgi:hypothetical protein